MTDSVATFRTLIKVLEKKDFKEQTDMHIALSDARTLRLLHFSHCLIRAVSVKKCTDKKIFAF